MYSKEQVISMFSLHQRQHYCPVGTVYSAAQNCIEKSILDLELNAVLNDLRKG